MNNEKIVEIYNNLLESLKDKTYMDIIWYKCISPNAFFDNYLKFYFFKTGMDEGYYPLTHFSLHKLNPKILEMWQSFQDDLHNVLPHKDDWSFEYLNDLSWLSKDGLTRPLCMELEQGNINEIIYDFKKLLFVNSSLKIMLFFNYYAFPKLLELLAKAPSSNPEEMFLLISLDKLSDSDYLSIGYIDYRVRGCIFSKNRNVPDLRSDTFSISIMSPKKNKICVEK